MAERKMTSAKEEAIVRDAINDYEKHKKQQEKKKIEPVVKGKVKTKKRSGIKKLSDVFISDDVNNIKSYIFMDVLVPATKKAISEVVTSGIDMLLYGETGRSSKRGSGNKISYSSYYDRDRRDSGRTVSGNRYSNRFDIDEIILETRAEAEEVLMQMDQLIDSYKMVSVADLYDLVGMSCDYTAQKYGWTNIRNAEVVRVRDGYRLKLPKILPID